MLSIAAVRISFVKLHRQGVCPLCDLGLHRTDTKQMGTQICAPRGIRSHDLTFYLSRQRQCLTHESFSCIYIYIYIGKGKGHPRTGHEGPDGEQIYSPSFPSTSALDGWSAPRPGRFAHGETWYPLYRRLGGPQGRSGRVRKISPPP